MSDRLRFYDRRRDREKTPAVRVGTDLGYFTVERLAGYAVVSRTRCPTLAVARAKVAQIARAEGIEILPEHLPLTATEVGADLDNGGDAA
ncbi:hypothetical protein [Methylobacterium sp.]|uniref:hypothetical protein n=1 Tax=Methylobacterium sp. TaxID=409 RepID=UPI003B00E77F